MSNTGRKSQTLQKNQTFGKLLQGGTMTQAQSGQSIPNFMKATETSAMKDCSNTESSKYESASDERRSELPKRSDRSLPSSRLKQRARSNATRQCELTSCLRSRRAT